VIKRSVMQITLVCDEDAKSSKKVRAV
jgi:hypothetical protein